MNKIANEDELVKKALQVGAVYAKKRAYGEVEAQDSVKLKVEFVYRVLVEDKLIQPLAKDQISDPNMRHKLALWISRQLPAGHPLLSEKNNPFAAFLSSCGQKAMRAVLSAVKGVVFGRCLTVVAAFQDRTFIHPCSLGASIPAGHGLERLPVQSSLDT